MGHAALQGRTSLEEVLRALDGRIVLGVPVLVFNAILIGLRREHAWVVSITALISTV